MLKLKYLFPNTDLAAMIVKNWDYDNLDLFKYWRISANAIYPFSNQNKVYLLRISPVEEKSEKAILAELEFLNYLKDNSYSAIQAKPSRNGRELEVVNTPWGRYYSVVFPRVRGTALDDMEISDDVALLWGKALGRLHKLSSGYKPNNQKRSSWKDQIDWMKEVLKAFPDEAGAVNEADILKEFFESIPVTEYNYGLIHYDFELDNVFYDKDTEEIIPIDFDDSMYHWYAMDIEQTLDSIRNELPAERTESVSRKFLEGYCCEYNISEDMIELFPVFRRFADLYGYVRILRSAQEKWDNEPEWLKALRVKLSGLMMKRGSKFGSPIETGKPEWRIL